MLTTHQHDPPARPTSMTKIGLVPHRGRKLQSNSNINFVQFVASRWHCTMTGAQADAELLRRLAHVPAPGAWLQQRVAMANSIVPQAAEDPAGFWQQYGEYARRGTATAATRHEQAHGSVALSSGGRMPADNAAAADASCAGSSALNAGLAAA